MSGQYHTPVTLPPEENPGTHLGGWVSPKSDGSNGFGNRESKKISGAPRKAFPLLVIYVSFRFPSSCFFPSTV